MGFQPRSFRVWGVALFDVVLSILVMALVLLFFRWVHREKHRDSNPWCFVLAAFYTAVPVGIVAHVVFGVRTTLNSKLGPSEKP